MSTYSADSDDAWFDDRDDRSDLSGVDLSFSPSMSLAGQHLSDLDSCSDPQEDYDRRSRLFDSSSEHADATLAQDEEALRQRLQLARTSGKKEVLVTALLDLQDSLWRHIWESPPSNIDEVIALCRELLPLLLDQPRRVVCLADLSVALCANSRTTKRPDDLKEAVKLHQEARRLDPGHSWDRKYPTSALALAVFSHMEEALLRYGVRENVILSPEMEVANDRFAAGTDGESKYFRQARQAHLLTSVLPERVAVQERITSRRCFLKQQEVGSIEHIVAMHALGKDLRTRFFTTRTKKDYAETVTLFREVVTYYAQDDSRRIDALCDLASVAWLAPSLDDLEVADAESVSEAEGMLREVISASPVGTPIHIDALIMLGSLLRHRFFETNSAETLTESIATLQTAVDLCKSDQENRSLAMCELALSLYNRFEERLRRDDIDRAVLLLREGSSLVTRQDLDLPQRLDNLADALNSRFLRFADISDLSESIGHRHEILTIAPDDHPRRVEYVRALASALFTRNRHSGSGKDLTTSISLFREAMELCDDERLSHFRPAVMHGLASTLAAQFELYAQGEDLQESICLYKSCLSLVENDSSAKVDRAPLLHGLADAFDRYLDQGIQPTITTFEEVLSIHRQALDLCTLPSPPNIRSACLTSLAVALHHRWQTSHGTSELGESITLLQEAVALSVSPVGRARPSNALANVLMSRFATQKNPKDLEMAHTSARAAIDGVPIGHSMRALYLRDEARIYLSNGYGGFERAVKYLSEALDDAHRPARLRVAEAVDLLSSPLMTDITADRSFPDNDRRALLGSYRQLFGLFPRVAALGSNIKIRLQSFKRYEILASEAAIHGLLLDDPATALEMLEEARAVFWTQGLRLRTRFDELRGIEGVLSLQPEIHQELARTSRLLEEKSYSTTVEEDVGEDPQRRTVKDMAPYMSWWQSERFEEVLNTVRSIEGFERLLLPELYASLSETSARGTVVVLVASDICCRAIVIKTPRGSPEQVSLPRLTHSRLRELGSRLTQTAMKVRSQIVDDDSRAMIKRRPTHEDETSIFLAEMWNDIVKPILRSLALKKLKGRKRPRLWWCPTGPFAFLPLHAAGNYFLAAETECCADYVVSSYTPTLGALLKARRDLDAALTTPDHKTMLVAVPFAPGHPAIPNVLTELDAVRDIVPAQSVLPLATGDADTTIDSVLSGLANASVLHLACHGVQDRANALESGFVLHDGTLTLSRIMQLDLPRAFFAFLSACETAKGDRAQPDQTVHLAAAMMFAGFRSVIGTMWEMRDADGPKVAAAVYTALFANISETGRIDPDTIPYALDAAVQQLRGAGVHPGRWAPYIHMGV